MGLILGLVVLAPFVPLILAGAYSVNGLYDLLYTLIGWTGVLPFWEGF